MTEFRAFPKIARWNREIIVTEKIDGTNACVVISEEGEVSAQSRTRSITPEDDNFGFAQWVRDNAEELGKLGTGYHYGEWWGSGIQRGYGLPKGERRFSLFNTYRWSNAEVRPKCCHVVPLLAQLHSPCTDDLVEELELLRAHGSRATPFMNPEGIIIFHVASNQSYKITLEKDDKPKGQA